MPEPVDVYGTCWVLEDRAPVRARSVSTSWPRQVTDGAMMAVRIQTAPTLTIGEASVLFADRYRTPLPQPGRGAGPSWDIARDGRFLMIDRDVNASNTRGIVLIENWVQELRSATSGT
jgi:hypothetical protein